MVESITYLFCIFSFLRPTLNVFTFYTRAQRLGFQLGYNQVKRLYSYYIKYQTVVLFKTVRLDNRLVRFQSKHYKVKQALRYMSIGLHLLADRQTTVCLGRK